jgi:hypothetical protein
MKDLALSELWAPFPRAQRASLLRKIKAQPNVTGVLYCETLMIGETHQEAMLLFGPGCTFETWQAAEGQRVQGSQTSLTNPLIPQAFAFIPKVFRIHPRLLDEYIQIEEEASLDELPRLWVGRKKKTGVWMNDVFKNPTDGTMLRIVTTGDKGNEFLVCPDRFYTEEMETDQSSPNYGYRKHHDKWTWMDLPAILKAGYSIVADRTGEIYCTLVADKQDERGIE